MVPRLYVFSIVVAGPGDADPQRRIVLQAIGAWNKAHSAQFGLRMEAKRWEDVKPALGPDAQSVINESFGENYSALIAVFRTRLGKPTPRSPHGSGTVEEIEFATTVCNHVMVYFYKGRVSVDLDAEELARLQGFKKSLRPKGLLGSYRSNADLREQLDQHLVQLSYNFREYVEQQADHESTAIGSPASGQAGKQGAINAVPPARRALETEIAANLRTLQELWTEINLPPSSSDQRVSRPEVLPAVRLAQRALRDWRRSIFEQRITDYIDLLTSDEAESVERLYHRLAQLDALRARIDPQWTLGNSYNLLDEGSKQAWPKFGKLAQTILKDGNPLVSNPDATKPHGSLASPQELSAEPIGKFGGIATETQITETETAVLKAAVRHALQSSEPLRAAALVSTNTDSELASKGLDEVRAVLRALVKRGLVVIALDQGSAGIQFAISSEGMRYGIPLVVPHLDEQVERIRRIICDLQNTTAEEVSHAGVSLRLVEQVALDLERQGLLKTRSYTEGTLIIEHVSHALCPEIPRLDHANP